MSIDPSDDTMFTGDIIMHIDDWKEEAKGCAVWLWFIFCAGLVFLGFESYFQ